MNRLPPGRWRTSKRRSWSAVPRLHRQEFGVAAAALVLLAGATLAALRRPTLVAFAPLSSGTLTRLGSTPTRMPMPGVVGPPGLIGFLYVNEMTTDRTRRAAPNAISGIAAYSDGSLILLPGSPWPTGGLGPSNAALIASPRIGLRAVGRRLYAVNQGSDDISVFAIADDGGLVALPGSPFLSGGNEPQGLAVTPDGRRMFVGHSTSATIVPFALGADGEPQATGPAFRLNSVPNGMAVTGDGRFLVVTLPLLARIAVLAIGPDGGLSHVPGSPFRADEASADGVALGRGGALVYVSDADSESFLISLYRLGPGGLLGRTPGSPFSAGAGPANILHLAGGGRILLATRPSDGAILSFTLGPDGRPLPASGSPFPNAPLGIEPSGLSSDPLGRFLYVVNATSDTVSTFLLRPDGRVEQAGDSLRTGVNGLPLNGLVFVPAGDEDGDGVADTADDCPALADPAQADADGDGIGDLCDDCPGVADPGQRDADGDGLGDACDADRDGDGLDDRLDLCPDLPDPFPPGDPSRQSDKDGDGIGDLCDNCPDVPNPAQEDADGDGEGDACQRPFILIGRLYAQTEAPVNSVAVYDVDTLGRLRALPGSPFPTGGAGPTGSTLFSPPRLALRPGTPPFLYAANEGSDTISVLRLQPDGTPVRTYGPIPALRARPAGLAISPDGSRLMSGNLGASAASFFSIAPLDGYLSPPPTTPFPTPGRVGSLAFAPNGGFVEVTLIDLGAVRAIDAGYPFHVIGGSDVDRLGGFPAGLTFNAAGDRLYIGTAVGGAGSVGTYAIDSHGIPKSLLRSPASGGGRNSNVVAIRPGGRLLYVSNQGSNTIDGFRVEASGSIVPLDATPFPNVPTARVPVGLAFDPGGRFLFVSNWRSNSVSALRILPDGTLAPVGEPEKTGASGGQPLAGILFVGAGDEDGDGLEFSNDNCPLVANPGQADRDGDGIGDACDDCPDIPDRNQEDSDGDGIGNACDPDRDGDGVPDAADNCPADQNPSQADRDGDRIGDLCDVCLTDPLNDVDGDGFCADRDNCPFVFNPRQDDLDRDGVGNACDNCLTVYNPNQADSDGNGQGDACQSGVNRAGLLYLNGLAPLNSLAGFETKTTGTLMPVPGSPIATGGAGRQHESPVSAAPGIAVAVRGAHLFALNPDSRTISVYRIERQGGLRSTIGSPFATGLSDPLGIVADPSGSALYVTGRDAPGGAGALRIFSVARSGRVIARPAGALSLDGVPDGLAISEDGRFLAIGLPEQGLVALYEVGRDGSILAVPGWPAGIPGIARPGPLLFLPGSERVPLLAAGELPSLTAAVTVVAAVPGGPIARASAGLGAPGGTLGLAVDRGGDRLFVSLPSASAVAVIDGILEGTPTLAPGSPVRLPDAAAGPTGLALTADGRILQVLARGSNQMVTFRVSDDGRLDPVPVPPVAIGILAAFPSAGLAFVAATDVDGDGLEQLVDNCPDVPNPGQEDANGDGAGDACQPSVHLGAIAPAALLAGTDPLATIPVLAVPAVIGDPDGEALDGTAVVSSRDRQRLTLLDAADSGSSTDPIDCGRGLALEGRPGEGIVYLNASVGQPAILDQDLFLGCNDGIQDYEVAVGPCDAPDLLFVPSLSLRPLALPADLCVRSLAAPARTFALLIESILPESADVSAERDVARITVAYDRSTLPGPMAIDPAGDGAPLDPPGRPLTLTLSASDGLTPPISDRRDFLWNGERYLVFGSPPIAAGPANLTLECASPDGTAITLDGSASFDPDGGPLDVLWFEDLGAAGARPIGSGPRTIATFRLGAHPIIELVRDATGLVAMRRFTVTVVDTTPPSVSAAATPDRLWPPDHRLVPIHINLEARDACAASLDVRLVGAASSEPDDAPGAGDGRTIGDIRGAVLDSDDRDILLRAERSAMGPGRLYTLSYRVADPSGNARTVQVRVAVPKDDAAGPPASP